MNSAPLRSDRVRRERENVEHHLAQLVGAVREQIKHGDVTLVEGVTVEGYALQDLAMWAVKLLSAHMPVIASPWAVTDMRHGEPTRYARSSCVDGATIACVRRVSQGKRARPRWSAIVGTTDVVSPEPDRDENGDLMPIDWSTVEEAQRACDARLREMSVRLESER